MVLADSSIVILALPEILVHYDVSINDVAWVLTLFNLVLAIVAVPAAHLARRRAPAAFCRVGLVVFAAASLGVRVAPTFAWLLASPRCPGDRRRGGDLRCARTAADRDRR